MAIERSDLEYPRELGAEYSDTFARLLRMFRARGIPTEDAADLAQETALRLVKHLRRNGVETAYSCDGMSPLINRIATNLLIDRARSGSAKVVSLVEAEDVAAEGHDPLDEVTRLHDRDRVRAAMDSLSPRHRHAIAMSLDGRRPSEIARDLGIARNAADALLFRARQRIAVHLRDTGAAVRALITLVSIRIWSGARRSADPTHAGGLIASQAAVNIIAATLATVAGFSGSVGSLAPAPIALRHPPTIAHVAGVSTAQQATPARARAERATVTRSRARVVVDPKHQTFGVHSTVRDPATGRSKPASVTVWHEHQPGDPGAAGPALDEAFAVACIQAPSACS